MFVIIQEQDYENATSALNRLGFSVTHMTSTSGFLSRRNLTILIGVQEGRETMAVCTLQNSCRKRIEFLSQSWKNIQLPLSTPLSIPVEEATIFMFEVESYNEF